MNIAPQELIGKTVSDCYASDHNEITVEFTNGTKVRFCVTELSEEWELKKETYLELEIT